MAESQRDERNRFVTGNNGGPGRPKGSRNKLAEMFLADLVTDWEVNGAQAITDMREEKPGDYVKVVAATLPRELNVKVSEIDELTDEQLARQLASLSAQLARAGIDLGAGATAAIPPQQIN